MKNVSIGTQQEKNFGHQKRTNGILLRAQKHKKQILAKISAIIDSGTYINGDENIRLKKSLSRLFNNRMVETVSSGNDALCLALSSLNLNKSDIVLIQANAYPSAFPIELTGATIRLCDVDDNGQVDIAKLRANISVRVKVILLVHMYGNTTNVETVAKIAKQHHIILIEDCAQSFGTLFNNKPVGTFGAVGCFSFFQTKNLGTLGDGGAIITDNDLIYSYVSCAKSYGEQKRYQSIFCSGHSRLPEIQAGILNIFFESIKNDAKQRKATYYYFKKSIEKKLKNVTRVLTSHKKSHPVPHLFVIETKKRDELRRYLINQGIETLVHYPYPIHMVPAFAGLGYHEGDFPIAERLSKNILSLPFHAYMTKKQIDHIVSKLENFYV